jgi:hypothetical protein
MPPSWAPQHRHAWAAWLSIVALLIDALLPSAVSAATLAGAATAPLKLCGAADDGHLPGKQAPPAPLRHCPLCAAYAAGLPPGRPGVALALFTEGDAPLAVSAAAIAPPDHRAYAAAQPRAPPLAS